MGKTDMGSASTLTDAAFEVEVDYYAPYKRIEALRKEYSAPQGTAGALIYNLFTIYRMGWTDIFLLSVLKRKREWLEEKIGRDIAELRRFCPFAKIDEVEYVLLLMHEQTAIAILSARKQGIAEELMNLCEGKHADDGGPLPEARTACASILHYYPDSDLAPRAENVLRTLLRKDMEEMLEEEALQRGHLRIVK